MEELRAGHQPRGPFGNGLAQLVELAPWVTERLGGGTPNFLKSTFDRDDWVAAQWTSVEPDLMASSADSLLSSGPLVLLPPLSRVPLDESGEPSRTAKPIRFGVLPGGSYSELQPNHLGSVLFLIVPGMFLFSESARRAREELHSRWRLRLVLTTRSEPNNSARFSAVAFSATEGRGVVWYELPETLDAKRVRKDLGHCLEISRGQTPNSYVLAPDSLGSGNWTFASNHPSRRAREESVGALGGVQRLGDIAEIRIARRLPSTRVRHVLEGPPICRTHGYAALWSRFGWF